MKQAVVSGVKWLAITKIITQLFRWGSTFLVIRLLNANDYGVMAIVEILVALLVSVNYLCIGTVIIRFRTISKPVLNTLFASCLIIGVSLFLIQYISAPYFTRFYETPEALNVLRLMSISYLVECFSVKPMAFLAKNMQFKVLAKIDLVSSLSMPIVVLICAYLGYGYWSLAIGFLVNCLCKAIMSNFVYPTNLGIAFHFRKALPLLKFGLQNTASSIIAQVNSSLDFMIGGLFLSTPQLGIYKVGLQISLIPLRKISPELRRISLPAFSRINNQPAKVVEYYLKSTRLVSVVIFPVFWGLSFVAEPIIRLLLTEKWIDSVPVIQILCMVLPFKLLSEMSSSMLNAYGRADVVLKNAIFSMLVFLISLAVLVQIGVIGLAYSWLIYTFLSYLAFIVIITKILPITISEILKAYGISFVGSIAMVIVLLAVKSVYYEESALCLGTFICLGIITYLLYMFVYGRALIVEINNLIRN